MGSIACACNKHLLLVLGLASLFLFYLLLLPYENENEKDKYIFLCSLLLGAVFMHDAVQLLICKSSPSLCGTRSGTAFFCWFV